MLAEDLLAYTLDTLGCRKVLSRMCRALSGATQDMFRRVPGWAPILTSAWTTSGADLDLSHPSLNPGADQNISLVKENAVLGFELIHHLRCDSELRAARTLATPTAPVFVSSEAYFFGVSGGHNLEHLLEQGEI